VPDRPAPLAHELGGAVAGTQDVEQFARLHRGDRFGAEQAAVGDYRTRAMANRRLRRLTTGIKVVTSAVLPGHISQHTVSVKASFRSA
jgi:hypothetical protein